MTTARHDVLDKHNEEHSKHDELVPTAQFGWWHEIASATAGYYLLSQQQERRHGDTLTVVRTEEE